MVNVQIKLVMIGIAAIIAIVLLIYLIESPNSIFTQSTTVLATTINSTNANTTSTTTSTSSTTSILITSCRSSQSAVPITNGDFGTDTYYGWSVTGTGFGTVPANASQLNLNGSYYGSPWSGMEGNFFATTYEPGFAKYPGNLTSDPFEVVEQYLNFRIISPQNAQLYVEIIEQGRSVISYQFNTYNTSDQDPSSTFNNVSIPISQFLCQNVSVRVVSNIVGTINNRIQYIAVSNFYQSSAPNTDHGVMVNKTFSQ